MKIVCAAVTMLTFVSSALAAPSATVGKFEMAYPFPAMDGRSLVFQGDFDGRWQLYSMALTDGKLSRLHVSPGDDTHPALSPDGKTLAFISNRDGNDEVYLLDLISGATRSLAPHPGKDGHPKWSADGRWLVFNRTFDPADKGGDGDSAIMRVRADGSELAVGADSPRVETFPSFSADGGSIVFVEWFPNAAGERNRNGDLVVVDIATKARRKLTTSEGFDSHPYWGASGDWIYFSTPVQGEAGGREFIVHRIRPDGTGLTRLTATDGQSEVRGMPSLDEQTLFYNVTTDGKVLIRSIPIRS